MSSKRTVFVQARTQLLANITEVLRNDKRFVAAWQYDDEQSWSADLDVTVVVSDMFRESLSATSGPSGVRTSLEQQDLFEQFGEPVLIYQGQEDEPEEGSITTVLYTTAITVRWRLMPYSTAQRPAQALVLFEKNTIPIEPPFLSESLQQRLEEAAVQVAYFWLMVPILIKYLIRHDTVFFDVHIALEKAERLLAALPPSKRSGWGVAFYETADERVDYLLSLCQWAQRLSSQIKQQGGGVPEETMPVIELWVEMFKNPQRRKQYAADREDLLARIVLTLKADKRFVAAWLDGSYVHGTRDDLSDLDLRVVVANAASALCDIPWTLPSFQTIPERQRLFRQLGDPLVAWETYTFPSIAEKGSFTLVYDKTTGVHVDWVLIPEEKAARPKISIVLFDKYGLEIKPATEPENKETHLQQLSKNIDLFWLLAAESWQYLENHDIAYYHLILETLQNILGQMRTVMQGIPLAYIHTPLYATQEEQIAALLGLCDEMERLMPVVAKIGGNVPASPRAIIEKRLELLEEG